MEIGMRSIAARVLMQALSQARGIGIVEEPFTLKGATPEGDCAIVVRNLLPHEYEAILTECKELDELQYLNAFQRGHVCRALVEINGTDFRDVAYVDDEVDDPKKPGQTKKVKTEIHKWLDENIVSTWSKESLFVAYRKIGDVISKAEQQSKEGVVFSTPDELPEEKLRRLLGEVKELEEDMPPLLLDKVYEEHGLLRKSTAEEIKSTQERLDTLQREQEAQEKEAAVVPPEIPTAAPVAAPRPPPEAPVEAPKAAAVVDHNALMRGRQPLNRTVDSSTIPTSVTLLQQPSPVAPMKATGRMAEYEALMGEQAKLGLDTGIPEGQVVASLPIGRERDEEVAELSRPAERFNPKAAVGIVDQPPAGGLNPRFRPPPR
jgi:hypothetical protein